MIRGAAAVAFVAGVALAGTATRAQPRRSADRAPTSATAAAAPVPRFDHAAHAALDPPVAIDDRCGECHGASARGELALPGRDGHQPCLNAGCHVDDFLGIGASTEKADPKRFAEATRFCLGCHASADGRPPARHTRAPADAVYRGVNPNPGFRVELDHFAHTGKAACRDCHAVDPGTFFLVAGAPGHAQCATCHGDSTKPDAFDMTTCAQCHVRPAVTEAVPARHHDSEVRACGSPGHLELAAHRNKPADEVPCFRHETEQHRFASKDEPLQCGACHFMIADQGRWGRRSYRSVADIRSAPIIHNERELAHKSCGQSSSCHKKDVDDSRGRGRCTLCHDQKTVDHGMFAP